MKHFRVQWTERHSTVFLANNKDEAFSKAFDYSDLTAQEIIDEKEDSIFEVNHLSCEEEAAPKPPLGKIRILDDEGEHHE